MDKKAQFNQLLGFVMSIAVVAIVLIVTFLILAQGKAEITNVEGNNSGVMGNATNELQGAVDDVPGWIPMVVIAGIGVSLLAMVKLFKK